MSLQWGGAAAGEVLPCTHSLGITPWKQRHPKALSGCRAATATLPRGQISCCFDLPLTSAVAAGKADPIDFMWIMIFCRWLRKLLIVHTAIYSILDWESEGFDGMRGYLHTQPRS